MFLDGQIPINGNVIREDYPNWQLSRMSGQALRLPLWNPYRNMGEPHLADPKTTALYPPFWAFLPFKYLNFFRAWILLHTALAAFFMGRLAYRWFGDAKASLAAAFIAGFNGFFMAHGYYPNLFASAAYFPAVLYWQDADSPACLGVTLALQWLAGYPPFCYMSVLAIFVLALWRRGPQLKTLFWGGITALGLSAVQLIPFVELLGHSTRPLFLNSHLATEFSIPVGQLLKEIAGPQWIRFWPNVEGDRAMTTFYVGTLAFALSLWGILRGGGREKRLALCVLASLLLTLGKYLPGYTSFFFLQIFRFPASWLLLATGGMALLTSAGITRLSSPLWKWLCVVAIALDLLLFAQVPLVAWFPPSFLEESPPLVKIYKEKPYLTRIYHPDLIKQAWLKTELKTYDDYLLMKESLTPSYGMAFGIREVNSYQVLRSKRAENFLNRLGREGHGSPLLQWAGVSYVVTLARRAERIESKYLRILETKDPKPPLFFAEESTADKVALLSYGPGNVRAQTVTDRPKVLVFSEVDYPGWSVTVDDRSVRHGQFKETFIAVSVPEGQHEVTFRFNPLSFKIGWGVSALTLLGLGGFKTYRRWSQRYGHDHRRRSISVGILSGKALK